MVFRLASALLYTAVWLAPGVHAQGDCFDSTAALLIAQVQDVFAGLTDVFKEYEICPGITIPIGNPVDAEFSGIVGGDFPLTVIRPNARIKCDGCVLEGGLNQLGIIETLVIPGVPQPIENINVDNSSIEGLTFKGGDPSLSPDILSGSVAIGAPGKFLIKNCTFVDRVDRAFFNLGRSSLSMDLAPNSLDITISECTFQNLQYYDYIFKCGIEQACTIEKSTFDNITFDESTMAEEDAHFFFECQKLATCAFNDNCVQDLEFDSAFLGSTGESVYSSTSGNSIDGLTGSTNATRLSCEEEASVYSTADCICEIGFNTGDVCESLILEDSCSDGGGGEEPESMAPTESPLEAESSASPTALTGSDPSEAPSASPVETESESPTDSESGAFRPMNAAFVILLQAGMALAFWAALGL